MFGSIGEERSWPMKIPLHPGFQDSVPFPSLHTSHDSHIRDREYFVSVCLIHPYHLSSYSSPFGSTGRILTPNRCHSRNPKPTTTSAYNYHSQRLILPTNTQRRIVSHCNHLSLFLDLFLLDNETISMNHYRKGRKSKRIRWMTCCWLV